MHHRTPILSLLCLAGCHGSRSFLEPASADAAIVARLHWAMAIGGTLIWLLVVGMSIRAVLASEPMSERTGRRLVIGGGVALPTVVLALLLTWGLSAMPRLTASGTSDLQVRVIGEQWWWRVVYEIDGQPVELANELVLPVGERVEIQLEAADVVHSFWVPQLAGKIDMIPGRINRIALEPHTAGVYEGVCAEYCGASHTHMLFDVVVLPRAEVDARLRQEAADAVAPSADGQRGQQLFRRHGCAACHTIRGTDAQGVIGPDLTHVALRHRLAAGTLDNDVDGHRTWLTRAGSVKPEVHMPTFDMLDDAATQDLVTYLLELK